MKIVNTSTRVVCIGGKYILPGESLSVSDAVAETAGMKAIVKVNNLTAVEEPKAEEPKKKAEVKKAKKADDVEAVAEDSISGEV